MGRKGTGGRLFVFLAGIIVLVILAGASLRSRGAALSWPEKFVMDGTSAISGMLYSPAFQLVTFFHRLGDLQTLYQENAALQRIASEDVSLRIQLGEVQIQNKELRKMLDFKSSTPQFSLIAAQVSGRSPLSWNSILTISAGSASGVKRDLPVLSQSGALLGRIVAVSQFSSEVSLLTSTESTDGVSAAILTGKGRPFGIISGSPTVPGMTTMSFISQLTQGAKPGDEVVTSGLSNMYPRGILIGRIKSFESVESGLTRTALVTPAADFANVDDVFVLIPQQGQLQP